MVSCLCFPLLIVLLLPSSIQERNINYVVQVEIFLSKVFSSEAAEDDEDVLYVSLFNTATV